MTERKHSLNEALVPQDQRQRTYIKLRWDRGPTVIGSGLFKLGPPPSVFIERSFAFFPQSFGKRVSLVRSWQRVGSDVRSPLRFLMRRLFFAHLRRLRITKFVDGIVRSTALVSKIAHARLANAKRPLSLPFCQLVLEIVDKVLRAFLCEKFA